MRVLGRRATQAGGGLALERLALYRRYAELVCQQEAALARGDADTFAALLEETAALQDRLGNEPPVVEPAGAPDGGWGAWAAEVTDLLQGALGATERIQSQLSVLRAETSDSLRRAREGHRHALEYAGTGAEVAHSLDLTA